MPEDNSLLHDAWYARDELYRNIFGPHTSASPAKYKPPKINRPEANPEADSGGSSDPGDEDQRLTVLTYAPDPLRPYWTYLTAGLSNPWYQDEPLEVSGFGMELMIKSPVEATWPAQVLRTMAFYVFNYAATLSPGIRIALNGPISVSTPSDIQSLLIWYADEAPDAWYQLPSGGFGIFSAVGITDDECNLAETTPAGTWCVQELLRRLGVGQVTDPSRRSVLEREGAKEILDSLKAYAAMFPQKEELEEDIGL